MIKCNNAQKEKIINCIPRYTEHGAESVKVWFEGRSANSNKIMDPPTSS